MHSVRFSNQNFPTTFYIKQLCGAPPHSFTARTTSLSCFPSAQERNPFISQAQAIQMAQKILTTAVQKNAERL